MVTPSLVSVYSVRMSLGVHGAGVGPGRRADSYSFFHSICIFIFVLGKLELGLSLFYDWRIKRVFSFFSLLLIKNEIES